MRRQGLKLKQASAVLKMEPKELQNLVQFGVVKPRRFGGSYIFDASTFLAARVASYFKECLGTRTSVLSKLMEAFSASEEELKSENPKYIRLQPPAHGGRRTNRAGSAVSSFWGTD